MAGGCSVADSLGADVGVAVGAGRGVGVAGTVGVGICTGGRVRRGTGCSSNLWVTSCRVSRSISAPGKSTFPGKDESHGDADQDEYDDEASPSEVTSSTSSGLSTHPVLRFRWRSGYSRSTPCHPSSSLTPLSAHRRPGCSFGSLPGTVLFPLLPCPCERDARVRETANPRPINSAPGHRR